MLESRAFSAILVMEKEAVRNGKKRMQERNEVRDKRD